MRVFLGWSGSRSKGLAAYLETEWLPRIFADAVEPWSAASLEAGELWQTGILENLNGARYAIVCVTPEALDAKWIYFEAGAVAKTVEPATRTDKPAVCALLVDVRPGELSAPLSLFQAKRADEKETRQLVAAINKRLPKPLTARQLDAAFEKHWSELATKLEQIQRSQPGDLPCHVANNVEPYPPGGYKLKVRFLITNMSCFSRKWRNAMSEL